jgi:hypothetical protein
VRDLRCSSLSRGENFEVQTLGEITVRIRVRVHGKGADNEPLEGDCEMVLWIVAGYCLTAVLFYSYLVATAEADPTENSGASVAVDDQRTIVSKRKAA